MLCCLGAGLVLPASEPRMFRGGPAHTGVYASAAPDFATTAWTFQTGGRIVASPVVSEGVVYVGSRDQALYALDAKSGALKWKFPTGGPVNASPAVADGLVVVGSVDGSIYAVDARSGKAAWTFKTGGERRFSAPGIHGATPRTEVMPDPFDVFLSSPAIAGGVVFVGSGDHRVYALELATGALKWSFETGNVVHASPAVADGVVYVGSWDRKFYALDAKDGKVRWAFETGDDPELHNQVGIASSAAVAEGLIFFGCRDGHFYALDAATGALRWQHDNHKGWVIASPAVAKGVVYFPTSDGTRFKALEARTGKPVFDVENRAISFSSPALAGSRAYYGTSDGWLHAVDLGSGREVAQFQTEGSKQNAAAYTDAKGRLKHAALYPDATLDGIFVGLERMYSLGSILSSPVLEDGLLYVGSTDGRVYALK
ncbi:MAG: PQQ-binding-like beta-propeller repeat protein [Holophagaceae bacterium]|nr:PQQ-binding-like beta-propeller repeat protein [Holophagaceae bacterium]